MRILSILKGQNFGQEVRTLQQKLNETPQKPNLTVDGWFGQNTRRALMAFQLRNGLVVDGIAGYNTYKALGMLQEEKAPKWLILHCTASPVTSEGITAASIVNYHTNVLGWGRPGYSRIVELSGKIVETWKVDTSDGIQPFEMTYGTGVREVDLDALNICYIGGVDENNNPKDTRTKEQYESLKKIVLDIVKMHPNILVGGHHQIFPKGCPCFSVPQFCEEIGLQEKNIYREDPWGIEKTFRTSPTPTPPTKTKKEVENDGQ